LIVTLISCLVLSKQKGKPYQSGYRVQNLGSKFRKAALQDCKQEGRPGILTLADKLRNICFVQGLYSDRIRTIVRSRNRANFDEIAGTALE
jgi:hypothetical protein